MPSSVGAAQDALVAAIAARALIVTNAVPVEVGFRMPHPPQPEGIWVTGVVPDHKTEDLTTGVGVRSVEESYTLDVQIQVEVAGANAYAEARAVVESYIAEVEAAIVADRTLGGAVQDASATGGPFWDFQTVNGGRGCRKTVAVACLMSR
jgi:hypothetical protein